MPQAPRPVWRTTGASRASRCWRQTGFTLIEILIVMVIIGILAAVATLNMGSDRELRALQQEGRRLQAIIRLAVDEAVLQNTEYGLSLKASSYEFLRYDPDAPSWLPLEEDERFGAYELPDEVQLMLELEGQPLSLAPAGKEVADEPAVLLLSSGEMTPFRITLFNTRDKAMAVTLSTDGFHAIEFHSGRVSF